MNHPQSWGPAMRAAHPVVRHIAGSSDHSVRVDCYTGGDGPIVVYLHGGGWIMGTSQDHPMRLRALADAGHTVLSVDYRRAIEAPYPAQQEDVEAVIDALVPDGAAPFIMGASAGAHLGALIALTTQRPCAGFIGLFGRYDLTSSAATLQPQSGTTVPAEVQLARPPAGFENLDHAARIALLAGVRRADLTEQALTKLSPVYRLHASAPPILAMHGTGDGVVSPHHSEHLVTTARRWGVPARLILVEGANHESEHFAEPDSIQQISDFIRENDQHHLLGGRA